MKLIIVSGLSGSGKTIALHTLEDLGYYCVDNLPGDLLPGFAEHMLTAAPRPFERVAVSIDARGPSEGLGRFREVLRDLGGRGIRTQVLYLEASDNTLLKRFSETRRRHPLTQGGISLAEALAKERSLLDVIARDADLRVDTTHTHVHQLRDLLLERLAPERGSGLSLLFQSFGYKHGVPRDADFVFDVRCLPNPYWEPALRPLTGRDPQVIGFLEARAEPLQMFDELRDVLERWIPRFERDNRNYLTVALGCTGGQHRSVYLAEKLAAHFRARLAQVLIRHREIP